MLARLEMPLPDSRIVAETRKALEWGEARVQSKLASATLQTSLKRIVWECLQDAVDTHRRLPDRERGWLLAADRVAWPNVLHTEQERYEAECQRIVDLKESPSLVAMPRLPVMDPTAIPRMLTVLGWLRYVRARTYERAKRDKKVVLALAQGLSARQVLPLMQGERTERAVWWVKDKVVGQISDALVKLLD